MFLSPLYVHWTPFSIVHLHTISSSPYSVGKAISVEAFGEVAAAGEADIVVDDEEDEPPFVMGTQELCHLNIHFSGKKNDFFFRLFSDKLVFDLSNLGKSGGVVKWRKVMGVRVLCLIIVEVALRNSQRSLFTSIHDKANEFGILYSLYTYLS